MAWAVLTGGIDIDWESFTGLYVYILGVGQSIVPLVVLELYFRARDSQDLGSHVVLPITIVALTAFMGIGFFAATMGT